MNDQRVTAKAFHEADGVEDWRVLFGGAHAHFRTATFREGARFVALIADLADAVGNVPDVDLRPEGVTVRTCSRADGALSLKDVELAQRISVAARELGLHSDPAQVQVVNIAVAQDAEADVRPFWMAAFGYDPLGPEDAVDPNRRNPQLWFHQLTPSKPGRGRVHIDVSLPADEAQARVDAALAAGGRLVVSYAPESWTLASPDNHGIDIAAWPDFEDRQQD